MATNKIFKTKWQAAGLTFVVVGSFAIAWYGLLSPVFSGAVILPQEFHIGFLPIHYYGVIIALGALAGWMIAMAQVKKYGIDEDFAEWIIFLCVIGGIIGSRAYHVLSSWKYYIHNPMQAIAIWNGGLGIYGAAAGGAIVLALVVYFSGRWSVKKLLNYLNWLTLSFAAAQAIGRWGNFFNYEAFGSPTDVPWKMYVPVLFRPSQYLDYVYFHPWFLYSSLVNLGILLYLWRYKRDNSYLFVWYMLLYNGTRTLLELLRADSTFVGPFRLNFLVSLGVTICAALFLYNRTHEPKLPQSN